MSALTFQEFLEALGKIEGPFKDELIKKISSEEIAKNTNMRDHFGFDSTEEIEVILQLEEILNITIPDQTRSYNKPFKSVWDWFEAIRKSSIQPA